MGSENQCWNSLHSVKDETIRRDSFRDTQNLAKEARRLCDPIFYLGNIENSVTFHDFEKKYKKNNFYSLQTLAFNLFRCLSWSVKVIERLDEETRAAKSEVEKMMKQSNSRLIDDNKLKEDHMETIFQEIQKNSEDLQDLKINIGKLVSLTNVTVNTQKVAKMEKNQAQTLLVLTEVRKNRDTLVNLKTDLAKDVERMNGEQIERLKKGVIMVLQVVVFVVVVFRFLEFRLSC